MSRKLCLLLVVLAAGFTMAACGSDNKNKDSSSTPAASTDTAKTDTATQAATTVPTNAVPPAAQKQAVAACKQSIQGAPQLKANIRSDLEKICVKAARGDEAAVKKAAKEVCTKIVEANAPAGPARDSALQACDQAAQ